MKKIIFCLLVAGFSFTLAPIQLRASINERASVPAPIAPEPAIPADAKTMLLRLDEIKSMDKSNLNSSEKKDLRKEVKSVKKVLKHLVTEFIFPQVQ